MNKCPYCGQPYKVLTLETPAFRRLIEVPRCDCIEEHEKARQARLERVQKIAKNRKAYKEADFPRRLRGWRLGTGKKKVKLDSDLSKWVERFQRYGKSLFFYGDTGTGKTTAAVAIGRTLLSRHYSVKFLNVPLFLLEIEDSYSRGEHTAFEIIEQLLHHDLVIFDDFGREKYTAKRLDTVYTIINSLYKDGRAVIFTAETSSLAELKKESGKFRGIFDRLREMCIFREFSGKSLRRPIDIFK